MSGSKRTSALPAPSAVDHAVGTGARATFTPARSQHQNDAPIPVSSSRQERGVSRTDGWPLRSYLALGALPSAVPCARLHAKQVLWEWGLTELADDVELLVSELTTNAVRVSEAMNQDAPIRLWLLGGKTQVLILVWDGNPRPPVRIEVNESSESGRGLLFVETLSEQWGWYAPDDIGGKWVWCSVIQESR